MIPFRFVVLFNEEVETHLWKAMMSLTVLANNMQSKASNPGTGVWKINFKAADNGIHWHALLPCGEKKCLFASTSIFFPLFNFLICHRMFVKKLTSRSCSVHSFLVIPATQEICLHFSLFLGRIYDVTAGFFWCSTFCCHPKPSDIARIWDN